MISCSECGSNLLGRDEDNDLVCFLCGHYMSFLGKAEPPKVVIRGGRLSGPSMTNLRHGTNAGYTWYKCRCAACIDAHAVYKRAYRAKRLGIVATV